ncbi:MAG: helix-turn-helix transcriptional regulator [Clostridia bacterium]|nr:helix-turn-helix transcriptional regulator [Clostridia bacterium]
MAIGMKIRFLRKKNNITQRDLAKSLCVTSQAISKWENGKNMPDISILPVVARIFGVSMDELFDFNVNAS